MLLSWQEKNKITKRYISSVLLIVFKAGYVWAVLTFALWKLDTKSNQAKADFWWSEGQMLSFSWPSLPCERYLCSDERGRFLCLTLLSSPMETQPCRGKLFTSRSITCFPLSVSVIWSVGLIRPRSSAALNQRPCSSGGDGWSDRCGRGRNCSTKWRRSRIDRRSDADFRSSCSGQDRDEAPHLPFSLPPPFTSCKGWGIPGGGLASLQQWMDGWMEGWMDGSLWMQGP